MPEASTNTAPAPAADNGAVAPAVGAVADGDEGVLGRLRDARGAPLSPRTRRAKAVRRRTACSLAAPSVGRASYKWSP